MRGPCLFLVERRARRDAGEVRPRLTLARETRAEHGIDRARAALQPRQRHQAPVVALGPEARRLGPAGRQRDAEIEQRIPAPDRVQPIPAEGRRVPEPAEVLPIVEGPVGRSMTAVRVTSGIVAATCTPTRSVRRKSPGTIREL